jgi:predicted ABC-type ATPase
LWIPSVDLAIARVAQRVQAGGHDIPEATIRHRYYQGLRNFFEIYVPLADRWRLLDNSGAEGPRVIERGLRQVKDRQSWEVIRHTLKSSGEGQER